jgi:hypothetical protein
LLKIRENQISQSIPLLIPPLMLQHHLQVFPLPPPCNIISGKSLTTKIKSKLASNA